MESYCIYGASGHGKVILEILENLGQDIHCFYDDNINKTSLLNYEVTSDVSIFAIESVCWIIGIGNNQTRKKIAENLSLKYGVAIDKRANVSKRTQIGSGTVIMPGVTINSSTIIGKHAIFNTNSSIDHDCIIGDYVHISPNAALCGGIIVGEGAHIGAGAVLIPGIKIGKWATIGAGAVIVRDVPEFSIFVGNPGRLKSKGTKEK